MENNVRQILQNIVIYYGRSICDDQRKLKALLMDKCPQNKLEINMILLALQEKIPFEIINNNGSIPTDILLANLELKLQKTFGLSNTNASWVVSTWSLALGIVRNDLPVILQETPVNTIKNIQTNLYTTMKLEDLVLDYNNVPNNTKVKIPGELCKKYTSNDECLHLKPIDIHEDISIPVDVSRQPLETKKLLIKAIPLALSAVFDYLLGSMSTEIIVFGRTVKDKKIIIADKMEVNCRSQ